MKVTRRLLTLCAVSALFGASCSINKLAIDAVASSLSAGGAGGNSFTSDDDPILVGQALPFAMKLFETLLAQDPKNSALALQTGSLFIMYANAYVQTPAEMLPDSKFQEQSAMLARAKELYLRGRKYVLQGLEDRHPGLAAVIPDAKGEGLETQLAAMTKGDVPYLFWVAAGWMGAYAINPLDFNLAITIKTPLAMMAEAERLDSGFDQGAIHEFYLSYDAAAPESLGGGLEKARKEYQLALKYSHGKRASVYVAYAQAIAVRDHDPQEFRKALDKAIAIDPNADRANRLATIIAQNQARWLLAHIDDYFLSP